MGHLYSMKSFIFCKTSAKLYDVTTKLHHCQCFSDLLVKERCVLLEQLIHVLIVHLIIEVVTRIDKYPYYVMNVVQ